MSTAIRKHQSEAVTKVEKDVNKEVKKVLDITRKQMSIRSILKERARIRFDMAIQRNNVWKETPKKPQKSLLIDSELRKYPCGQVFVNATDDGIMWMADGKQRWESANFEYIDNKFPLATGLKPVLALDEKGEPKEYDIEGKFFKDLDPVMQERLLDYEYDVQLIHNATQEEIETIFVRLNGGTPLSAIELTLAEMGESNMSKVAEIGNTRFFADMANITSTSRNGKKDDEVIVQTLMLVMGRKTSIGGDDIREFSRGIKVEGLPEDALNVMLGTSKYLEDALEQFVTFKDGKVEKKVLDKMLRKAHIPRLFMIAVQAIEKRVEPEVFGLWAKSFLNDRNVTEYSRLTKSGSAKKSSVEESIKIMTKDFKANIEKIKKAYDADVASRKDKEEKQKAEDQEWKEAEGKAEGSFAEGKGEDTGEGEGKGKEPSSESQEGNDNK